MTNGVTRKLRSFWQLARDADQEHQGWTGPSPLTASLTFGQLFFGEFWTSDGNLDVRRSDHRDLFERSVARNLAEPCVCPEHRVGLSAGDIEFSWSDSSGSIAFPACCERAGRRWLIRMLTFASDHPDAIGRPQISRRAREKGRSGRVRVTGAG